MCYHSNAEISEALAIQRARARSTSDKLDVVPVIRRDRDGNFLEAYPCNARDEDSIAHAIDCIKGWHPRPDDGNWFDVSQVNDRRREVALPSYIAPTRAEAMLATG